MADPPPRPRTAGDAVRLGLRLLAELPDVPPRERRAWLRRLGLSDSHARRLRLVARVFGKHVAQIEQWAPSAAYELAHAPELVRRRALLRGGLTRAQALAMVRGPARPGPPPADWYSAEHRLWELLAGLLADGGTVTLTQDTDADGDLVTYTAAVIRGGRRSSACRQRLDDALRAAAGAEPTKPCPRCGRVLPLSAFADDRSSPDGRLRYCRDDERRRVKDYAARKRGSAGGQE